MVCLVFLVSTYDMEEASSYVLPRLVSVLGLVVGTFTVIVALIRGKALEAVPRGGAEAHGLHVMYSILFAVAYFLACRWLGFILSTFVAMLAFSYLLRFPRKKLAVVLAIAVPLILHLAFVTLLQASLPAGIVEHLLF